jgi:plastocyanin
MLVCGLALGLVACGGGGGGDEAAAPEGGAAEQPADSGGETAAESPVDPATAGSISGKVTFTGTAPENEPIDMEGEPDCAAAYTEPPTAETYVVGPGGELANAFVYVKEGLGEMAFPAPTTPVTLDQSGCRYHPHVLGVQVGQPLEIVNSDPVGHNIHPVPAENRGFNLSQPKQGMTSEKTFTQPEVMIPVGCDVHNWMSAWIGVLNHPYFAVTGEDGSFELPNLPPGTYTIAAWHEDLGEQTQEVTVEASGAATADLTFQ